ncbi:hypothetical protein SK128_014535, partial [Halocaridina rubra]
QDECVEVPCDLGWECHNTAGSYSCHELPRALCPAGYKPSNISATGCEDVDECVEALDDCHSDSEICINEIGKYRCEAISINEVDIEKNVYELLPQATFQTPVQECAEGFGFDISTKQCLDIDECGTGLHNCTAQSERCINTLGGFICRTRRRCSAGYALDSVTGECKDVDECLAGVASCMPGQICINTEGAFECRVECQDGFVYDPTDSAVCVDVDECLESPCRDRMFCINTEGSYTCSNSSSAAGIDSNTTVSPSSPCSEGFRRNALNICEDLNECREDVCEGEQRCQNTPGSFLCVWPPCAIGYRRDSTTNDCEDINECVESLDNCKFGIEECINTPGSHRCRLQLCSSGYRRILEDPSQCSDIDECESSPCGPMERCVNNAGSYRCLPLIPCLTGFRRDPESKQCEDISKGEENCSCTNEEQYVNMQDINECEEDSPCSIEERCVNIRGSYRCRKVDCAEGYHRDELGRCRDINECDTGEHTCKIPKEECINIHGSFRCRSLPDCPAGFTRDPKSLRCVARGTAMDYCDCLEKLQLPQNCLYKNCLILT